MITHLSVVDSPLIVKILSSDAGSIGVPQWTPEQVESEFLRCQGIGLWSENKELKAFIFYFSGEDAFEISHLATDIKFRGQGAMSALLSYLISICPEGTQIWLDVHAHNLSAQRLYIKHGFAEVGRRKNFYSDGEAAILFSR